MEEIFTYILTYSALFGMFLGIVQFLTNGFFLTFIRVKASRGKKILVIVRSKIQRYAVAGKVLEGRVVFKDAVTKDINRKTQKGLIIPKGAIYRMFNVNCVDVNEERNTILVPDSEGDKEVAGHDAIKQENLITRALQSPELAENKFLKIIIVLLIILGVGLFIIYSKVNTVHVLLTGLQTITGGTV